MAILYVVLSEGISGTEGEWAGLIPAVAVSRSH